MQPIPVYIVRPPADPGAQLAVVVMFIAIAVLGFVGYHVINWIDKKAHEADVRAWQKYSKENPGWWDR